MENATTTAAVKERRPAQTSPANKDLNHPDDPEMARVLEGKRWEKREEPFQGFGSPQGKF